MSGDRIDCGNAKLLTQRKLEYTAVCNYQYSCDCEIAFK